MQMRFVPAAYQPQRATASPLQNSPLASLQVLTSTSKIFHHFQILYVSLLFAEAIGRPLRVLYAQREFFLTEGFWSTPQP